MSRRFFIRRNADTDPATWDVLRRRRVTVLHVHSRDGRRVEDREPVVMRMDIPTRAEACELARKLNAGEIDPEQIFSEHVRKMMPR